MSLQANKKGGPKTPGQIFAVPLVLGIVSAAGLIAALVGDGFLDAVSWVTLALPCAAGIWYWAR